MSFLTLLNNNQGLIEAIGLFLVIPLALLSGKIHSSRKEKKYRKELRRLLLKEFWINLNFVSQLEISYENNRTDSNNLHIPLFGPRITTIEKFFEFDLLKSLGLNERDAVVEIYDQLKNLRHEYYLWREYLVRYGIQANQQVYTAMSSTMILYIEPVMRNMLDWWVVLVKDFGAHSTIPQIQELSNIIRRKIKEGKWIRSSYKASFFNKDDYKNIEKFDVILCWHNDWPEAEKEIIEIKNTVRIHESWN